MKRLVKVLSVAMLLVLALALVAWKSRVDGL